MKRKPGSQPTFSQIDGEAGCEEERGEEERKEEEPEAEEEEIDEEFEKIWDGLTAKWTKELEEKIKKEKGEEEENETTVTNDPMSTLGPTRNPTDPEVTTEPTNHNRCQRPLQRARERREARLQKESDAHAVLDPDPHGGPQRSSLSCDLEQDRPQPQCCGCNNILTESDLSAWDDLNQSLKRAGLSRLAEIEDAPACAACLNHWSL